MTPIQEPANLDEPTVVEAYELTAEMADRASARRGTTNAFFIAVLCALLAVITLTAGGGSTPKMEVTALCVTGMIVAVAWFVMVMHLRDICAAKMRVIMHLEKRLSSPVYRMERKALRSYKTFQPRYVNLAMLEQVAPAAFNLINLCVMVLVLFGV